MKKSLAILCLSSAIVAIAGIRQAYYVLPASNSAPVGKTAGVPVSGPNLELAKDIVVSVVDYVGPLPDGGTDGADTIQAGSLRAYYYTPEHKLVDGGALWTRLPAYDATFDAGTGVNGLTFPLEKDFPPVGTGRIYYATDGIAKEHIVNIVVHY